MISRYATAKYLLVEIDDDAEVSSTTDGSNPQLDCRSLGKEVGEGRVVEIREVPNETEVVNVREVPNKVEETSFSPQTSPPTRVRTRSQHSSDKFEAELRSSLVNFIKERNFSSLKMILKYV